MIRFAAALLSAASAVFPQPLYRSSKLLRNANQESEAYTGAGRIEGGAGRCSAFLISTSGAGTAPAYVLTNGHCIRSSGANEVILDADGSRLSMTFGYFVDTQDRQYKVAGKRIVYSTMKGTDVAVVELDAALAELKSRGYRPLVIAQTVAPDREQVASVGAPITGIPAGESFLRVSDCTLGPRANLIEFTWHWWDMHRIDCADIKGGSSGSAVISRRTGEAVAIVNTSTSGSYERGGGFDCYLDIPCEVTASGGRVVDETSYAAPLAGIGRCFDSAGRFDVNLAGCPLDNGRQMNVTRRAGRVTRPPASWDVTVASDTLTHYRYKAVREGDGDCRESAGYRPPVALSQSNLIGDSLGGSDGRYYLCVIGGAGDAWQDPKFATMLHLAVDTQPPVLPSPFNIREDDDSFVFDMYFAPPEISSGSYKAGKAGETNCEDPQGFGFYRRVPVRLNKSQGPWRVCAYSEDEAGNRSRIYDYSLEGTQIFPDGVRSAASGQPGAIAPSSIVDLQGVNFLSPVDSAVPRVDIGGIQARLHGFSPNTLRFVVPAPVAPGETTVTVTSPRGAKAAARVKIEASAPGVFGAGLSEPPAAMLLRVRPDGTRSFEPVFSCARAPYCAMAPLSAGGNDQLFLEVYGTGIRGASGDVQAFIGVQPVEVLYAGAQQQVEGLDQVNLRLPAGFALRGYQVLTLIAAGKTANRWTLWFTD